MSTEENNPEQAEALEVAPENIQEPAPEIDPIEQQEEVGEQHQEEDPPQNKLQKRFDKMTREKYELKAQLAYLQGQIQAAQPQAQPQTDPGVNLDPSQFTDYDQYVTALARATAQKAYSEQLQQIQQEQIQNQARASMEAAKAKYKDFEEAIEEVEYVAPHVQQALVQVPNTGDVAYYLAKNPGELAGLNGARNPMELGMKLGEIQAKLKQPKPVGKTVSSAPPPIRPVSGTSSPNTSKPPEDFKQYEAWHRAQGFR